MWLEAGDPDSGTIDTIPRTTRGENGVTSLSIPTNRSSAGSHVRLAKGIHGTPFANTGIIIVNIINMGNVPHYLQALIGIVTRSGYDSRLRKYIRTIGENTDI